MRKLFLHWQSCLCIGCVGVIVILLYGQSRPSTVVAAQTQDPLIEGALQSEADRIRVAAATDEQCLTVNGTVTPQYAKDKAIVRCFVDRLRGEAIDRISQDSFRLKALEKIENAKQ